VLGQEMRKAVKQSDGPDTFKIYILRMYYPGNLYSYVIPQVVFRYFTG